jgi:hypothetical protein
MPIECSLSRQDCRTQPLVLVDWHLERINCIAFRIVKLQFPPVLHCQAPLPRAVQASPASPLTSESYIALPLCPLHIEANIDPAVHLIDLATNPRIFGSKIDLVAKFFAYKRVGAERVEGRGDDRGLLLLIVEENEHRDGHGDDEYGESLQDLWGDERWDAAAAC